MKHYLYVLIVLLFLGCSGKTPTATDAEEISNIIDLSSGLKNIQTVLLSEIVDSITFIPFETTQESLQGQGQNSLIYFSSQNIFYANKRYDWTGKYLGSIGRRGQGPYEEPEGVWSVLFKNNHFYSKGSKFIEYDITGKSTGKVRNLYTTKDFGYEGILMQGGTFFSVGDNFAVYNYPLDIYFFNKNFETLYTRKIVEVDSVKPIYQGIGEQNAISYYKDHVLFYNFMNDTIFYVKDSYLEPKWIVSFNDPSRLTTEAILNADELLREYVLALRSGNSLESTECIRLTDNKHKVIAVYETEKYMFFQMTEIIQFAEPRGKQRPEPYVVLFDKQTGKTVRVKGNGFIDDILGMDTFYPLLGVYDEKLITYIWPFELLKYIDECREKGKEVNPQLIELSKKIDAEDNPILILAHLKK